MILYLIRHGESTNNRLAVGLGYDDYMAQRSPDPTISEIGERQAQRLAEYLRSAEYPDQYQETPPTPGQRGYGITHLFCSPMLRTLQTALPVSDALDLPMEIWLDIHEQGGMFHGNPRGGDADLVLHPGLARQEITNRFPRCVIPETITENGWSTSGYEDLPGCYARAMRVARRLRRRAKEAAEAGVEERLALLSHGTFLECLLKTFFHQAPDGQFLYQHYNTGITRLDFLPSGPLLLRYMNRTEHLPPELITV